MKSKEIIEGFVCDDFSECFHLIVVGEEDKEILQGVLKLFEDRWVKITIVEKEEKER